MIYLTFTTLPGRINKLHTVLDSIMKQTLKPDRILLWIPNKYNRLSETIDEIPEYLLTYDNLYIHRCDDLGPITKMYYTYKMANENDIIVSFDDDVYYPPTWLENMVNAINKYECAVGYRGKTIDNIKPIDYHKTTHLVMYTDKRIPCRDVGFITSTYGMGYRKYMYGNTDLIDYSELEDGKFNDDLWLCGILAKNGVDRLVIPHDGIKPINGVFNIQSLWAINKRSNYNNNILNYYADYYIKGDKK